MRWLRAAILAVGVGVVGCATVEVPRAMEADVRRAGVSWPGTSLADLHHGRELFLARCTGCHQPIQPRKLNRGEWPAQVAEMKDRAHLDTTEADLVVRYLVTMAEAPDRL